MKYSVLLIFMSFGFTSSKNKTPRILSSLYGYDGCIGGVNNFDTEEEYLDDLKRRNCTVENGHTNVDDHHKLNIGCKNLLVSFTWMDGMPIVFNYPLEETPSPDDFQLELSDGSFVTPACVMMGPANEQNEYDTALILGKFGDGAMNTLRPVRVNVTGDIKLVTNDGIVSGKGLSHSKESDMNYLTSTVRLVYAKMWDTASNPEDFHYPNWPLPSSVYPNHCGALYENTTHVIRAAFSGGVTLDGIASVPPTNKNVFRVTTFEDLEIEYLGLADLGKTIGGDIEDLYEYEQDGDNYIDICLDLTTTPEVVNYDINLEVLCDSDLANSVLYPPKGKPYGCKYQRVTLTNENGIMEWES